MQMYKYSSSDKFFFFISFLYKKLQYCYHFLQQDGYKLLILLLNGLYDIIMYLIRPFHFPQSPLRIFRTKERLCEEIGRGF